MYRALSKCVRSLLQIRFGIGHSCTVSLFGFWRQIAREFAETFTPATFRNIHRGRRYAIRLRIFNRRNIPDSIYVIKLCPAFPISHRQKHFSLPSPLILGRHTYHFLLAKRCCNTNNILHSFQFCVVSVWSLSADVVNASTPLAFKLRLSRFDVQIIAALKC